MALFKKTDMLNVNRFVSIFLYSFLTLFPLIIIDGYNNITEVKYRFYLITAFITLLLVIISGFEKKILLKTIKSFQYTKVDISLIALTFFLFISLVLSDYKSTSFFGYPGWYTGFLFFMTTFLIFFMLRYFYIPDIKHLITFTISIDIVCVIGILDRISIHLIHIKVHPNWFLSTIGNINWFAGLLSIAFPVVFGFSIFQHKYNCLFTISSILIFTCALFLGCDSSILFLVASFAGLGLLSLCSKHTLCKYMFYFGFLLIVANVSGFLITNGYISGYNYHDIFILLLFINKPFFSIIGLLFIFLSYALSKMNFSYNARIITKFGLSILIICVLMLSYYVVNYLLNNFSLEFGNSRGAIIQASFLELQSFTPKQYLFGVGLDCYNEYGSTLPSFLALTNSFFDDVLTNSHCEPLTNLITMGLIGTVAYYLFFFKAVKLFFSSFYSAPVTNLVSYSSTALYGICCVSIISYLLTNLTLFITIYNYPLIIILIAVSANLVTQQSNISKNNL